MSKAGRDPATLRAIADEAERDAHNAGVIANELDYRTADHHHWSRMAREWRLLAAKLRSRATRSERA
jgi:hypothetical protein